jgi:hypothetical protein
MIEDSLMVAVLEALPPTFGSYKKLAISKHKTVCQH